MPSKFLTKTKGIMLPQGLNVNSSNGVHNGVLYINVRGLLLDCDRTKCQTLSDLAQLHQVFAIVVTETWLHSGILDTVIQIQGFNVYRADRNVRGSGGTCTYLRDHLSTATELCYSNTYTEALTLKVKELDLIIFSIYRPPDTQPDHFLEVIGKVNESVNFAQAHGKYPRVLGFGDLNLPEI